MRTLRAMQTLSSQAIRLWSDACVNFARPTKPEDLYGHESLGRERKPGG